MTGFDVFDQLTDDHAIVRNEGWENDSDKLIQNCTWYANSLGTYCGLNFKRKNEPKFYEGVHREQGRKYSLIFDNNMYADNEVDNMFAFYVHVKNSVFVANTGLGAYPKHKPSQMMRDYDGAAWFDACHFVDYNKDNNSILLKTGAAMKHTDWKFTSCSFNHSEPFAIDIAAIPDVMPLEQRISTDNQVITSLRDIDGSLTGNADHTIVGSSSFQRTSKDILNAKWNNAYLSPYKFAFLSVNFEFTQRNHPDYPSISAIRKRPGELDKFQFVSKETGAMGNLYFPVIVNEKFDYELFLDHLPETKKIRIKIEDTAPGDTFYGNLKHIGSLNNLAMDGVAENASITRVHTLSALNNSATSAYYKDGNDLKIKIVATGDEQDFIISWSQNIDLPMVDNDQDGMSDKEEIIMGRDAFDQGKNCEFYNAKFGAPCNDYNPLTKNDRVQNDCSCKGVASTNGEYCEGFQGTQSMNWRIAKDIERLDRDTEFLKITSNGDRPYIINDDINILGSNIDKLYLDVDVSQTGP